MNRKEEEIYNFMRGTEMEKEALTKRFAEFLDMKEKQTVCKIKYEVPRKTKLGMMTWIEKTYLQKEGVWGVLLF